MILRYHDLIVAIRYNVQKVNISNPFTILGIFYIFIKLDRKKKACLLVEVGNLQFENGSTLPKPITRFLKFFICSAMLATHQKWLLSTALTQAQEGEEPSVYRETCEGRFSTTVSYCSSFVFIMKQKHCDLHPLKFWFIIFSLCTPSLASY